jgi:hypothetical protein
METYHPPLEHLGRGRFKGWQPRGKSAPGSSEAQVTQDALASRLSEDDVEAYFKSLGSSENAEQAKYVWRRVEDMRELLWPKPHDPTTFPSTSHVRSWLKARNMHVKLAGTKWMKERLTLLREYEVYRPDPVFIAFKLKHFHAAKAARDHPGNPANRANQLNNRLSQ